MGDIEFGRCDICHNDANLKRTYFRYDIKCECHSPYHFELISHCSDCVPKEPTETKIHFRTDNLSKLSANSNKIPNPPVVPLHRVLREGYGTFCSRCGSTASRSGFLGLFGNMVCHNEMCKNSK